MAAKKSRKRPARTPDEYPVKRPAAASQLTEPAPTMPTETHPVESETGTSCVPVVGMVASADVGTVAAKLAEGEDALQRLLALLRAHSQFDFRCYRKKMLLRRVERRMGLSQFHELPEYLAHLGEHADEIKQLARDLLISVTSFFRDADAFHALETEVLAPLLKAKQADAPLRVWMPGCATGEEAYSLAMLVLEQLTIARKSCRLQLFATDVDADALEVARQGVYPESVVADLPPQRLARFFTKLEGAAYQINKQVREAVVFAPQNLIADAPFSKMDLVSCRNLLIYLEPEVQKKVIRLFHFALNEGGYLFLGPSETIGRQTDLFEAVSKKWRIFRRIGPSRPERVEFPISAGIEPIATLRLSVDAGPARSFSLAELTQRLVLEELGPAAVLINRKYEILFFLGPTTRYLDVPAGEPTQDLLRMAREGLCNPLRSAVHKAIHDGEPVQIADVPVRRDDRYVPVRVSVKPVRNPKEAEGLLLVVFQDAAENAPQTPPRQPASEAPFIQQLESELRATKEDLQSSIEEMESSNEELKAANEEVMSLNEELQAANEELETAKEELQSLNEELSTVNNQLHEKVEELEAANNDMANLLNCTDIPTLFLDTDFRIRRFTTAANQLLRLIPTDIGRPIRDIALKSTDAQWLADAAHVLRRLTPLEKEVRTQDGRWWFCHIVPYRTREDRIEGVVITFVDVTHVKTADQQARLLAAILKDSNDAVIVHDLQGRIVNWNRGAERLYGYTEVEALRMNVEQLIPRDYLAESASAWARLERGERIDLSETRRVAKDGRVLTVLCTATPLTDETGRRIAFAKTDWDITELTKARSALEDQVKRQTAAMGEHEERLRAILNTAADAIVTIDHHGIMQTVNPATERMFGFSAAEMIGQNVSMLMPSPYREEHGGYIARYLRTGETRVIGKGREVVACHKDGTNFSAEVTVSQVDHSGLYTGIIRDIRKRKELEREVVEIALLEQRRIGQDLHDECGQELTALGLLADGLVGSLENLAPEAVENVRKMGQGVRRVLRQVRNIARGLSQVQISPEDLSGALVELTMRLSETSDVDCVFQGDPDIPIRDSVTATHLFHIAQEACTNALKHSQCTKIAVRLQFAHDSVILRIQDDGIGIPRDAREGLGRRIMTNRASVINAQLAIEPAHPQGTLVTCTLSQEHSHVPDKK